MIIVEYTESADFHEFLFDNGATCNIGKQSESNPDGVANYDAAIEVLIMNFPDLVI